MTLQHVFEWFECVFALSDRNNRCYQRRELRAKSTKLLCLASVKPVLALQRGENHAVMLIHNHFNPQ